MKSGITKYSPFCIHDILGVRELLQGNCEFLGYKCAVFGHFLLEMSCSYGHCTVISCYRQMLVSKVNEFVYV